MSRPREERHTWVVELEVAGIAVVAVQAGSADEACAKAIASVRPVDVGELRGEAEAMNVAGPFAAERPRRRRRARAPETASAPAARGAGA